MLFEGIHFQASEKLSNAFCATIKKRGMISMSSVQYYLLKAIRCYYLK